MSVATPTLLPRSGHFPHLLPPIPTQGEPKPPAPRGRSNGRLNTHRNLDREMGDLSDEEAELEGLHNEIRKHGHSWLVATGRMFTEQEEKNDAEEDDDDDDDDDTAGDGDVSEDDDDEDEDEDGDNDGSARDLDASLEDMDGDVSGETEEMDDEEEEYEE